LPKAESADHVKIISDVISELEIERGMEVGFIELAPRIESASAFLKMDEIAAADPRVTSFGMGGEDFALSLGVEPTSETLLYPKQRMMIAARAAGITPIGLVGSGTSYADPEALTALVRKSRQFGFEGATCIHPAAVPILNKEFMPTLEEVERAKRLLAVFQKSIADGVGAINFEGQMVDYPVAFRSERLLRRYETFTAE
jgi:citrate lyase subunit beta / citryl-CoA lyase